MSEKTNFTNLITISKYHQDKGLTIIGLNDNLGFSFYKNFLTYLKEQLTISDMQPEVIDAYLTSYNQTWQLASLLKHNLSINEIENIKLESLIEQAKQKYQNNFLQTLIIDELNKRFNPSITDRWEFLSEAIKKANEPLIIYSSGLNDLPNTKPEHIIEAHQKNFESIYALNTTSTIYMLEIPKIYHPSQEYQENLYNLCQEYGITTIPYPNIANYLPSIITMTIPSISNYIHREIANTIIDTYATQIINAYITRKELKEKGIIISTTNILSNNSYQIQAKGKLNNFKIDSLSINGMLKDIEEKLQETEDLPKIKQLKKEQLILTRALNKTKIEI